MACQFKCNADVSIQQNGIFGFGVIIRDSNGLCCAGKLVTQIRMNDPTLA